MTRRRSVTTILILALVIVGGISVPYGIEVVKVRSLRQAYAARVAALEARGVPLTREALEATLPPLPPEAENGAPLLREAARLYEARWPDLELPLLLFDIEELPPGDTSEERAELWAELQAAAPDLEPLWGRIDEAVALPFFRGETGYDAVLALLELRDALRPKDRAHGAWTRLLLALPLPTVAGVVDPAYRFIHSAFRSFEAVLVEDIFTPDEDLDVWALLLESLEEGLSRRLGTAVARGRVEALSIGRSSAEAGVEHYFFHEVGSSKLAQALEEYSAYSGFSMEGHALAALCRDLDAWDRVEACLGDEARLRDLYLEDWADLMPSMGARSALFLFFRCLNRVRLMRVGIAIAVDRRAGRPPAESLQALARRHGFALPMDTPRGEPLAYEVLEGVVRIGFGDPCSKRLCPHAWDIPRWEGEGSEDGAYEDDG